jgi:hypothetical protein
MITWFQSQRFQRVNSYPYSTGVQTKSVESFKVMTECPLIVMLLFQLYSRLIPPNIQMLLPLMVGLF